MSDQNRMSWDCYAASWGALNPKERQAAFQSALAPEVVYTDPTTVAKGYDELAAYMEQFQASNPGGGFEITYFHCHHNQSIAKWQMKSAGGETLGDGISHAEYDERGKLTRMTGFFESAN